MGRRSQGGGVTPIPRISHDRYLWHGITTPRDAGVDPGVHCFRFVFFFLPSVFFFSSGVWLAKRPEPDHLPAVLSFLTRYIRRIVCKTSLRRRSFRLYLSSSGSLGAPPGPSRVGSNAGHVDGGGGRRPPGLQVLNLCRNWKSKRTTLDREATAKEQCESSTGAAEWSRYFWVGVLTSRPSQLCPHSSLVHCPSTSLFLSLSENACRSSLASNRKHIIRGTTSTTATRAYFIQ